MRRIGSKGKLTFQFFADRQGQEKIAAPSTVGTYFVRAVIAEDDVFLGGVSQLVALTLLPSSVQTSRPITHMTVIELLCDQNRLPEYWSQNLPLDLPIDEVSDYFGEKLGHFPLLNEMIVMKTIGMASQNILLEPADNASAKRLEDIRRDVSERAGVKFPNHDNYQFHISVGYLREPLTEE